MYNWLIEIEKPKYPISNVDENFHIEKAPTASSTSNISTICQLFSGNGCDTRRRCLYIFSHHK